MFADYKAAFHISVAEYFTNQSHEESKRMRALLPNEKSDIIRVKCIVDEAEQTKERNALPLNTRLKYDASILETRSSNEKTLKRVCKEEHKVYVTTEDVAEIIIGKHEETAHGTVHAVTKIVQRGFYGIPECLIKEFINSCPICLLRQKLKTKPYERTRAINSSGYNERTQWDLIDMRSVSDPDYEFNYLLNRVDHTGGFNASSAVKVKTETEVMMNVAKLMCKYGISSIFQTDNGTEFINFSRTLLSEALDFKTVSGRARHPQSQGSVERNNGLLCSVLGKLMEMGNTKDWAKLLDLACAITNNRYSRVIKMSPFKFVFGVDLFRSDGITNIRGLINVLLGRPREELQSCSSNDEQTFDQLFDSIEKKEAEEESFEGAENTDANESESLETEDDSETDYRTSDLLAASVYEEEEKIPSIDHEELEMNLSRKRLIRETGIRHREVYAKKRAVDPKNTVPVGTTVRVSVGNNPTTPLDAKSILAVVTGNTASGYQLGTLQGNLKGSFSAVEPLPANVPKAMQIPIQNVPKKNISIVSVINKQSLGHPGKAHICCKCKSGCTKKSCTCLKNDRACSSHCQCIDCKNTEIPKIAAKEVPLVLRPPNPPAQRPPAPKNYAKVLPRKPKFQCKCITGCQKKSCTCFKNNRACSKHCSCMTCENSEYAPRIPNALQHDDTSACALGANCIMLQRTGSLYGASHNCKICDKAIHNLCNYGRVYPNAVLMYPDYNVEDDEICSIDCFHAWVGNLGDYPPSPM